MLQTRAVEKNQNTNFMPNKFFFPENRVVYEIMWKNTVERGRPDNIIRRMRTAFWVTKATNPYIYIYIYIYIYGAPILDVSRSHTTTQHSR